jgi:peptidoglycan hydrolase CwlO-like protein
MKYFVVLMLFVTIIFNIGLSVFADDATPTPTPTVSDNQKTQDLQKQIADLQSKISDLKSQQKSLNSQIEIIDNQTELTVLKIADAQDKIKKLKEDIDITRDKISSSEGSLQETSHAFIGRAEAVYKQGGIDPWQVILTSNSLDNFITRLKYLKIVQLFDKRQIYASELEKVNYQQLHDILEGKKKEEETLDKQLQDYNDQLNQDKESKKALLAQTQGSEENYQRLLAQAQAQLAGFASFVTSHGGASLLSGQTSCDDWGCYYNQRDSQWGGIALNNTSYTIAGEGCLMTSMAMVYTHLGHTGVTPLTINSNSSNFASYEPAWLNKVIVADGVTTSRVATSIDAELGSGRPVIVGISYDGGPLPDHFVVLISGSNGSYQMNDPFTPNGHNIPFTDHYSVGSIREIEKVVVQ